MKLELTRRRFGQLAIASTAVAGIGYLANKTVAQTALVIYGARPNAKTGRIDVQALNVTTGEVQPVTTAPLEPGEKLTGFTSLANAERTLVLAISPVRAGKKQDAPTRLVFLGTSPKTLTVSGLKKENTLESLLGTNDGLLYTSVIKKNGRPPVELVTININTNDINASDISTVQTSLLDKIKLPQTERFINLAQCPDGTIYTIAVGRLGETSLVQLDLGKEKPNVLAQLNINGAVWNSGLSSLVCSPAGQLLALGAPRYVTPNKVYVVNPSNGTMTLLTDFDVSKITILRA